MQQTYLHKVIHLSHLQTNIKRMKWWKKKNEIDFRRIKVQQQQTAIAAIVTQSN